MSRLNQELNVGDRVMLIDMEGESSMDYGMMGTVTAKAKVLGDDHYSVKWDNGSNLSLINGADKWTKDEKLINAKHKKLEHRVLTKSQVLKEMDMEFLSHNTDVLKNFNIKFFYKYLKNVRDSGIVNMHGAAPYLYMGKDRIKHEFEYEDVHDEEAFEKVLDEANQAQSEMIHGVMKVLDKENKEPDMDNINRYLQKYSQKVLLTYMSLF